MKTSEYHEGPEALKNFENTMTKLFRTPKTVVKPVPKKYVITPGCWFTVENAPDVSHPEIYARVLLYIPSPFSPAKIKTSEYLCSSDVSLALTTDLLIAMGAIEHARV